MAGVVLAVAGLAMAVLATRMTDIGHFTGLVASAGAMFAGAAVLWVQASRIG